MALSVGCLTISCGLTDSFCYNADRNVAILVKKDGGNVTKKETSTCSQADGKVSQVD